MRLSLFNAFATPVAFGAQRLLARAVRFDGMDEESRAKQEEVDKKKREDEANLQKLKKALDTAIKTHDLKDK